MNGRLMNTFQGLMGTAPLTARPGDFICVFPENNAPVLLRRKGCDYQLIGECFVEGLMKGEAIEWAEKGLITPADITLC